MIAHLRGRLTWAGADQVVVDVGGVGYRAFIPASTRARLPAAGSEVLLHTSLQVREDSMTLYAFLATTELELFATLLGVSGIGPKVALGILSAANPDEFRRAVVFEDIAFLTRLPQIGKKTAQRLVLELREKFGVPRSAAAAVAVADPGAPPADPAAAAWADAMEALVNLGYGRMDAAAALEQVAAQAGDPPDVAALVRLSLRWLGARKAV